MRRPPGTRSNIDLIVYATLTLLQITILIAGHALLLWLIFGSGSGLEVPARTTGLPSWLLWLSIPVAIAMDAWIYISWRRERKKALKR